MRKIQTASLIALGVLGACTQNTDKETRKQEKQDAFRPNILWISCEDITPALGCYGDSLAVSPHIDRLASQGVRYTNAFSVAGVCAPSRCALITGMYPTSIGGHNMRTVNHKSTQVPEYSIVPPPEVKCFSEYLRAEGYFCTNNSKTDYQFHPPITAWDENGLSAHWKHRQPGQPFFAVFNLVITHESRLWANSWYRYHVLPEEVNVPPYYPDHPQVRRALARNYSNIALMDAQVGMYLAELEQAGLTDSTIVVFFSDHGGPLPRQKRELYDTGLKVPLIVRFPEGKNAGTVNDELVSFVDFAPSMLSLAGIELPEHFQGQAFVGEQKAQQPRKYIFAGRDRMDTRVDMVRAVRDKRFKYLKNYFPEKPYVQEIEYRKQIPMMRVLYEYHEKGLWEGQQKNWWRKTKDPEELFDLENDPYEFENLAEKPEYQEKLTEMRRELERWQEKYGDWGFTPEGEMVKQMWNGADKAPQTAAVQFEQRDGKIYLTCTTQGASIAFRYGKDSHDKHWDLYTTPIEIQKNDTLKAVAIRIGYEQSPTEWRVY